MVTWPWRNSIESHAKPSYNHTRFLAGTWNGGAICASGASLPPVLQGQAETGSRTRSRRQLLMHGPPSLSASCGVTPHGGAAVKTKGPAIQKDIVGHAKDVEKLATPRGIRCFRHPRAESRRSPGSRWPHRLWSLKSLIPTTDAGALQQLARHAVVAPAGVADSSA